MKTFSDATPTEQWLKSAAKNGQQIWSAKPFANVATDEQWLKNAAENDRVLYALTITLKMDWQSVREARKMSVQFLRRLNEIVVGRSDRWDREPYKSQLIQPALMYPSKNPRIHVHGILQVPNCLGRQDRLGTIVAATETLSRLKKKTKSAEPPPSLNPDGSFNEDHVLYVGAMSDLERLKKPYPWLHGIHITLLRDWKDHNLEPSHTDPDWNHYIYNQCIPGEDEIPSIGAAVERTKQKIPRNWERSSPTTQQSFL
jgi:hypothetical protein